ncbi:adhesion G protein-coupled receptor E5-like [Oncorhynchus tshawytscha]|uniref:adhesion G protein-coupled receptor E5-like n=1 Tax=Oncorhynchus tshawytscha TaxID=74940 RepID=UPI001C3E5FB3|nr:adhesion G protein-coupled receptor E5-like [Oncorhynchus tshawytscha]
MGSRTLLLVLGLHFTLLGNLEAIDCGLGFTAKGRKQCDDIDECKEKDSKPPCGSKATCYNTQGSFHCQCQPGFISTKTFKYTPPTGECKDMDECKEQTADCPNNSSCVNTPGSYTCICQSGYKLTESRCEDIDECQDTSQVCGSNASCLNTIGSFHCQCQPGFRFSHHM